MGEKNSFMFFSFFSHFYTYNLNHGKWGRGVGRKGGEPFSILFSTKLLSFVLLLSLSSLLNLPNYKKNSSTHRENFFNNTRGEGRGSEREKG